MIINCFAMGNWRREQNEFPILFPVVCWGLVHGGSFVGGPYVSFVTASIYHFSIVFFFFFLFFFQAASWPVGRLSALVLPFPQILQCFQSLLMVCVKGLLGDWVSDTLLWVCFAPYLRTAFLSGLRHLFIHRYHYQSVPSVL